MMPPTPTPAINPRMNPRGGAPPTGLQNPHAPGSQDAVNAALAAALHELAAARSRTSGGYGAAPVTLHPLSARLHGGAAGFDPTAAAAAYHHMHGMPPSGYAPHPQHNAPVARHSVDLGSLSRNPFNPGYAPALPLHLQHQMAGQQGYAGHYGSYGAPPPPTHWAGREEEGLEAAAQWFASGAHPGTEFAVSGGDQGRSSSESGSLRPAKASSQSLASSVDGSEAHLSSIGFRRPSLFGRETRLDLPFLGHPLQEIDEIQ